MTAYAVSAVMVGCTVYGGAYAIQMTAGSIKTGAAAAKAAKSIGISTSDAIAAGKVGAKAFKVLTKGAILESVKRSLIIYTKIEAVLIPYFSTMQTIGFVKDYKKSLKTWRVALESNKEKLEKKLAEAEKK